MYFTQNHFKYPHLIYARECGLTIPIETRNTTYYILGTNGLPFQLLFLI